MIDYTQLAFASPANVVDPIPSVADYLDEYEARNAAWYNQWAVPIGPDRWGSRETSFQRRSPWLPPDPTESAPETLVSPGIDLTVPEDTRVLPGDQPIGQIVRDPQEMTSDELWDAFLNGSSPTAARTGAGLGASMLSGGTLGTGLFAGLMAQAGVEDYNRRIGEEIGRRMGGLNALRRGEQSDPNRIGTRQLTPGGPTVFTSPDILPDTETGSHQGTGGFQEGRDFGVGAEPPSGYGPDPGVPL